MTERSERLRNWLLAALVAIAVFWALRAAQSVAMPLAWALLVALAVWPVSRKVSDSVPRYLSWLGPTAAMLVVLGFLGLFFFGLWLAAMQLVELGRDLAPAIGPKLQSSRLAELLGGGEQLGSIVQNLGSRAMTALSTATGAVAALILILFLVLLMLTEGRTWSAKIVSATGESKGEKWPDVAAEVGQKFRTFFLARLILGTITAALYAGWLFLFGIDYLLLWAVLAVLLNFLPTVGSLIAGALPVVFVFVQKDLTTALAVGAGLLVIEQFMGNFVDPKVMGRQLSISPLVVLSSLLFWSWMWGIPGAFLAVPLTVLIAIVFAHVEPLKPIALMLSDHRDMRELEER